VDSEIRTALRQGVAIIDEVLKGYGVPGAAAEKLARLRDYHLSLLAAADNAPPAV
jgi:hypothetical protein